jgi:insulysin
LIGHEGKNSLLSYLKAEDLAVELCTDLDHNMSSLTFLEIEITLTKHGLQNYERVAEAAFQYIKNVEASGPQEYFFKENQDIGIMNFKFADKGGAIDTVTSLAGAMPKFTDDNVQDMIRVKHEIDEFDQEKCRMYAKLLCDPSNMNLILKSKDFEGKTTDVLDWYDTKYSTEDIPEDLMKKLQNPNSQIKDKKLGLPPVNKLIAKNFDILPNVPILLKSWPGSADLWYKKDEKFNRPKSIIHMKLYTNDCLFSIKPEARVFASVWKSVLEEYLREFKYMAEESRLALEITLDYDSLDFQWEGFNDSMPNFIVETMTMVKQMPSEDLKQIFAQVKEQLLLEWKNFYLEPSYRLVTKSIQSIVVNVAMEKKQLRHHLESFNFDQF